MNQPAPFFWIRKIASHLQEHDQIPLFGQSPSFDWEQVTATLARCLGVPHFSVSAGAASWKTADTLQEGLGDDCIVFPLKLSPLTGSAFWIMPKESVRKLSSGLMNGQIKGRPLSSEALTTGFYRYLVLQALDAVSKIAPFEQFSMLMSENSPFPQTDAFCIDIEMNLDKLHCWGRLAIEPALRSSWAEFFAKTPTEAILSNHAKATEVTLGVKVGSVQLHQDEWNGLNPGDFILLDQESYDPRKHQGAAYLMLGTDPLFQLKIKQNKLQLGDYAFIYEDSMAEHNTPEASETKAAISLSQATETSVSLKDLPVHLTVELTRMKITLEKLMQLTPGNLIELPIHPEQTVKLTVNGQLIGHAELVHLGENLGIRILSLD